MPDLSMFPAWVQVLTWVLFAIGLALGGVITRTGISRGKRAASDPHRDTQIAMVTLDSTVVKEHTAAVQQVADELKRITHLGEAFRMESVKRHEEAELHAAKKQGYEEGLRAGRRRPTSKAPAQ